MATRRKRTTRRKTTTRRRANTKNGALKRAAAAVAGGSAAAIAGGLLVRSGIKPTTAAVGLTVAGGVAAMFLRGGGQLAAGGAAAAGAGQLALAWMASQNKGETVVAAGPGRLPAPGTNRVPKPARVPALFATRRDLGAADVEMAFDRARDEIAMLDEASRMAEDEGAYLD